MSRNSIASKNSSGRLKSFDLLSDIHLDIHAKSLCYNENITQAEANVKIAHDILPEAPSPVLVIAGDLGHCNKDNASFLKELSKYYQHILLVFGNHDLYLIYDKFADSEERWQNMKQLAAEIKGLTVLDGDTIEIDGVTFGGTGMWYDYSYGQALGYSAEDIDLAWRSRFNDANHINKCPRASLEKAKLSKVIDNCDVIVTHISPDPSKVQKRYKKDICSSFFYFDSSDFVNRIKGKIWCFGHSHTRLDYKWKGCRMVSHDLGYPNELEFTKAKRVELSGILQN